MRKKLEIIYNRLLEAKLDENILCSQYWGKILLLREDFTDAQAWELLTNNIIWLINTNTITTEELTKWFTEKDLNIHEIYSKGNHEINDGKAIGIGTAAITATGHSWVVLFDQASCEAFDTTHVKGFHNSSFTLKNCSGEAFNNCTFKGTDFSKVETWDKAKGEKSGYSVILRH